MLKKIIKFALVSVGLAAVVLFCCLSEREIQSSWERDNVIVSMKSRVVSVWDYDLYLKYDESTLSHSSNTGSMRQDRKEFQAFSEEARKSLAVAESAHDFILLLNKLDAISKKETVKADLQNIKKELEKHAKRLNHTDKEVAMALYFLSQNYLTEAKSKNLLQELLNSVFHEMFYGVCGNIELMRDRDASYILNKNNDDVYSLIQANIKIDNIDEHELITKALFDIDGCVTKKISIDNEQNYYCTLGAMRSYRLCKYMLDKVRDTEELKTHFKAIEYYKDKFSPVFKENFKTFQTRIDKIEKLEPMRNEVQNFALLCKQEVLKEK